MNCKYCGEKDMSMRTIKVEKREGALFECGACGHFSGFFFKPKKKTAKSRPSLERYGVSIPRDTL